MGVQALKTVTTGRNGVGAFILQCKRIDLHYCDWAGSSRGMNEFLASPALTRLTQKYPATEFRVSPRPHKHPILKAHYINGHQKSVCLRNLDAGDIVQKAELMLQNTGSKNQKIRGKNVVSTNEGVRGMWSAFHGALKAV